SSWVADIGISLRPNGRVGEAFSGFGATESRLRCIPKSLSSLRKHAKAGTHTAKSIFGQAERRSSPQRRPVVMGLGSRGPVGLAETTVLYVCASFCKNPVRSSVT